MKPAIKPHPALASAKRAIRRGLSRLTPQQVFELAFLIDSMENGGTGVARWDLTGTFAADHPAYTWQCDAPTSTRRAGLPAGYKKGGSR